jgi:colicin import membrane protein
MKRSYTVQSIVFTVVVHVLVFGFLIISFDWSVPPPAPVSQAKPVEAVVVDENKVKAQMEKLRRQEEDKKKQQAALDRKAKEAERKRKAEERRIAELKKKRAAEEKQRKAEAARLARLRKEKEALAQKQAEEAKRLAKLEAERKAEEERKRQAAAEKKRKAEEAERKAREEELRQQLEAEERAAQEAKARSEIAKYVAYIRQKVTRNWLKPIVDTRGLKCTVNVKLIPSGEVVGVTIVHGSGNALFDRSVESAVRKASPLPLPEDPALVNRMRDINFVFNPEA